MQTFHNLLEPPSLIRHFREHPPEGFTSLTVDLDLPAFATRFDLLTTLEPAVRRRIDGLPLARRWRTFLRRPASFIGTTVSEYGLFPPAASPEELARSVVAQFAPRYPLVIIKDIPTEATLVGDEAFSYSRRLVDACRASGFALLEGQALAYVPIDFKTTDEYLGRLSHTRRRNLRRKLRSRAELDIEAVATGDRRFGDERFTAELYALYRNVYEQSEIHFDLLTPAFFRAVLQDPAVEGTVFLYRAGGALIGWNLCISRNGMLIDKYVGFAYPESREHDLYTVSWLHNLEYALRSGLHHYIAGWTDPEIKRHLGAHFTFTLHAVYFRNPLLRALLKPLRRFFEADRQWHEAHVANTHS